MSDPAVTMKSQGHRVGRRRRACRSWPECSRPSPISTETALHPRSDRQFEPSVALRSPTATEMGWNPVGSPVRRELDGGGWAAASLAPHQGGRLEARVTATPLECVRGSHAGMARVLATRRRRSATCPRSHGGLRRSAAPAGSCGRGLCSTRRVKYPPAAGAPPAPESTGLMEPIGPWAPLRPTGPRPAPLRARRPRRRPASTLLERAHGAGHVGVAGPPPPEAGSAPATARPDRSARLTCTRPTRHAMACRAQQPARERLDRSHRAGLGQNRARDPRARRGAPGSRP